MVGRELVSQEREKSGTKKYPVLGIFRVKEKNVRGKGGFLGLADPIMDVFLLMTKNFLSKKLAIFLLSEFAIKDNSKAIGYRVDMRRTHSPHSTITHQLDFNLLLKYWQRKLNKWDCHLCKALIIMNISFLHLKMTLQWRSLGSLGLKNMQN